MKENEAIEYLKFLKTKIHPNGHNDNCVDVAIKALEETQMYRALGTMEELSNSVKEEDVLKFYYCESRDDYYIGKRIDTMYYARYEKTGFVWFMSRYLPWGEYVIDPTSWEKEHAYPSEPKEIPFFEWLTGFLKKYCGGTVKELRKTMEKQRVKKPIWKPYEWEDENNPDPCCNWHCPTCGKLLTDRIPGNNKDFYFHCLNCGQKFDWSEEE